MAVESEYYPLSTFFGGFIFVWYNFCTFIFAIFYFVLYNIFMPKTYNAAEYADRDTLELAITSDLGKTTEKKDATIVGTTDELRKLFLSHGQSVWGVDAIASDYEAPVVVSKINRGIIHTSSLNTTNEKD